MGPFWLYVIYPFAAFFKGDPLVLGALTSVLGVATTFLIYFLGSKMFSIKVGLLAALMYAASALMIFYDQQGYPPAVPFWSILMITALYLTKQSKNKKLIVVLESINASVNGGETLSRSLEIQPDVFSNLFVSMVKAGEESGKLSYSLRIVADQLEKSQNISKKIRI